MSNVVEILNLERHERLQQKRKVCAYARVSTNKEIQETSLALQIQTYTKMINKNAEWNFVGVYSDQGKSGTNIKYRNQLNLMVTLAKAGNIDMIITKSISRFARNTIDCLSIIQELKEYNTEVWFEKENISSFDPKIEFVISVLAGMAEEEARIISENVKWGVRKRFQQGQIHLVTSQVLGYQRDKDNNIIIDDAEAIIVRKIYELYLKGYSYNSICTYLTKKGLKTKLKGVNYNSTGIRNILINEKYTGNALLQKSARRAVGNKNQMKEQNFLPKYYVKNTHPAIISEDKWNKVQDLRKQKGIRYNHTLDKKTLRNQKKNVSIYNNFIKCPRCGKNYQLRINHPNEKYRTRMFYCSSNRIRKTCKSESLFADTFDEILMEHINMIIKKKGDFLNELKTTLENHPEILKMKNEIIRLENELLQNRNKLALLDKDEFSKTVHNQLLHHKLSISNQIVQYKNMLLTTHNVDFIIQKTKAILRGFKNPISTIEEFPFKELFNYVIVRERDNLEFVIRFENGQLDKPVHKLNYISKEYLIRKTIHTAESEVCVY
ncbi:MAG: recombinase family protein [Tenericutes bacterium]|nr:recombinase family protein [Mycoplasmatota bacterium]